MFTLQSLSLIVLFVHITTVTSLNTSKLADTAAAMMGDSAGKKAAEKIDKVRGNTRKAHVPDGLEKFEVVDGKNTSIPVFYARNGESWKIKCPAKKSLESQVVWTLDKKGLTYPYTRIFGDCKMYCVCSSAFMSPKSFDLNLESIMSDLQGTYTCRADNDATWSFYLVVRGDDQCHPNIVFYVCVAAFIVVLILALIFVCCITWSEKFRTASNKREHYVESPRCVSNRIICQEEPCVMLSRIQIQDEPLRRSRSRSIIYHDEPPRNQSRSIVYHDDSPRAQSRRIIYQDEMSYSPERRNYQEEPSFHSQQQVQMRSLPRSSSPRFERRVSF